MRGNRSKKCLKTATTKSDLKIQKKFLNKFNSLENKKKMMKNEQKTHLLIN